MSPSDHLKKGDVSLDFSDIPDPLEGGAVAPTAESDLITKLKGLPTSPTRRHILTIDVALGLFLFGSVLAFASLLGVRRDWSTAGAIASVGAPLLLATPAFWLARSPGAFGLGPSRREAKVVFAMFGALSAAMILAHPASQSWPERSQSIAACCAIGLGLGLSLGALVAVVSRGRLVGSALVRASLLGLGVGAVALSAVGTHCRVADWVHVGIGHMAPVALLVGLGALLSHRLRA